MKNLKLAIAIAALTVSTAASAAGGYSGQPHRPDRWFFNMEYLIDVLLADRPCMTDNSNWC